MSIGSNKSVCENKIKKAWGVQNLVDNGTTMIAFLGAFGIILIAAVVMLDVLMRWTLNAPIMGVDDICIFVIAVAVSSFFPLGLAKGHFVTVRMLGKALGGKFILWFEVIGAIFTLGVFVFFAWRLLFYSIDVTRSGLATVVLQFRQAPWWWTVTVIMIACVPVQLFVLTTKIQAALSGNLPVQEPDAKSADRNDPVKPSVPGS